MLEVVVLRFIAPNPIQSDLGTTNLKKIMIFWNCHVLPTRPSLAFFGVGRGPGVVECTESLDSGSPFSGFSVETPASQEFPEQYG